MLCDGEILVRGESESIDRMLDEMGADRAKVFLDEKTGRTIWFLRKATGSVRLHGNGDLGYGPCGFCSLPRPSPPF